MKRDRLEDELAKLTEPTLIKYKQSLKKNPKIDFRNFASYEIAKSVIRYFKKHKVAI